MGPLENDAALDIAHTWQTAITDRRNLHGATSEEIVDVYLEASLGNTMDSGDADTTSRLIALAELFTRDKLPIPRKAFGYFEEAINWELRRGALAEWDSPTERKAALEALLHRIGGRRRQIRKSKLFRHPALEFQRPEVFIKKVEQWLALRREHKALDPSWDEVPRFWHVLDRFMNNQLLDAPDQVRVEVTELRLTMLAAYTGWVLDLPDAEVLALARRAKDHFTFFGSWMQKRAEQYRVRPRTE